MIEESEIMKDIHKIREEFYSETKGKDAALATLTIPRKVRKDVTPAKAGVQNYLN